MKKILLSIVAAGFALTSFAHGNGSGMEMGNILLYGMGTYSNQHGTSTSKFGTANSSTVDEPRVLNYQIAPGVGFNITDNLTIGVDASYSGTKTTYDKKTITIPGTDQIKTFDYGVGPFVRYSQPLSEHFFAFGQFTAHYLKGRETYRTATAVNGGNTYVRDDNYKGFDASFIPAVGAMLTKTLGLTFAVGGIGYQYQKYDYSTQNLAPGSSLESKNNEFIVTFGQQFNLGIQKYFGCGMGRHRSNAEPMDETRRMDTSDDESSDDDKGSRRKRNRRSDDE